MNFTLPRLFRNPAISSFFHFPWDFKIVGFDCIILRIMLEREGWRMVKSETRRDAEILVRNPSPRLFGKKFRDSKKVNTNHAKTRLRDLSKTLPRFRDPAKIFRDPRFSRYHSPPLERSITYSGNSCKRTPSEMGM